MLTSNRSDFRPYTRSASVTISNRRVRTRTHGGVAGVSGQPLPLCRSSHLIGMWPICSGRHGPHSENSVNRALSSVSQGGEQKGSSTKKVEGDFRNTASKQKPNQEYNCRDS